MIFLKKSPLHITNNILPGESTPDPEKSFYSSLYLKLKVYFASKISYLENHLCYANIPFFFNYSINYCFRYWFDLYHNTKESKSFIAYSFNDRFVFHNNIFKTKSGRKDQSFIGYSLWHCFIACDDLKENKSFSCIIDR